MTGEKEASRKQRAGHWLKCPICGAEKFWHREAMLNTRLLTLFDLDWINPRGDCYICDDCRYILWFYGEEEKLGGTT